MLVESADGQGRRWSTVGVSANVVDASFQALQDAILWKLMRDGAPVAGARVSDAGGRRAGRARRSRAVADGDDGAAGGAAGADGALCLQPRDRAGAVGGVGADARGDPAALVASTRSPRSTTAGRRGGTRWSSRWRRRSGRRDLPRRLFEEMIAARLADAEAAPHADRAALDLYIDHTAGHLMELAARHLGAEGAALPVVRDFARGAGTAALLRALPELRARGRDPLPDGVAVDGAGARRAGGAGAGAGAPRPGAARGGAGAARRLAGRAGAARGRRPIRAALRPGGLETAEVRARAGLLWRCAQRAVVSGVTRRGDGSWSRLLSARAATR